MTPDERKSTSVTLGPSGEAVRANIRRIRTELGMSLRELESTLAASEHPIAHSGLSKIENGTRRVDVDDLMALSVALGVSPLALLVPASRGPLDLVE